MPLDCSRKTHTLEALQSQHEAIAWSICERMAISKLQRMHTWVSSSSKHMATPSIYTSHTQTSNWKKMGKKIGPLEVLLVHRKVAQEDYPTVKKLLDTIHPLLQSSSSYQKVLIPLNRETKRRSCYSNPWVQLSDGAPEDSVAQPCSTQVLQPNLSTLHNQWAPKHPLTNQSIPLLISNLWWLWHAPFHYSST